MENDLSSRLVDIDRAIDECHENAEQTARFADAYMQYEQARELSREYFSLLAQESALYQR